MGAFVSKLSVKIYPRARILLVLTIPLTLCGDSGVSDIPPYTPQPSNFSPVGSSMGPLYFPPIFAFSFKILKFLRTRVVREIECDRNFNIGASDTQ